MRAHRLAASLSLLIGALAGCNDIFDSKSFAPRRANRSYYSNPQVDSWIEQARTELDQQKRKEIYAKIQQQVLRDLPSLNLWALDNVIVHTKRVRNVQPQPAGNYDFLREAEIVQ